MNLIFWLGWNIFTSVKVMWNLDYVNSSKLFITQWFSNFGCVYDSDKFQIPLWLALLGGARVSVCSCITGSLSRLKTRSHFLQPFPKNSLRRNNQKSLIQQQLQFQFTGFPNIEFYQIGKVFNLFLKISDNFWLGPHSGGWVWFQAGGVKN